MAPAPGRRVRHRRGGGRLSELGQRRPNAQPSDRSRRGRRRLRERGVVRGVARVYDDSQNVQSGGRLGVRRLDDVENGTGLEFRISDDCAPVAQWIERLTTDQKVGGSSPPGRAKLFKHLAAVCLPAMKSWEASVRRCARGAFEHSGRTKRSRSRPQAGSSPTACLPAAAESLSVTFRNSRISVVSERRMQGSRRPRHIGVGPWRRTGSCQATRQTDPRIASAANVTGNFDVGGW